MGTQEQYESYSVDEVESPATFGTYWAFSSQYTDLAFFVKEEDAKLFLELKNLEAGIRETVEANPNQTSIDEGVYELRKQFLDAIEKHLKVDMQFERHPKVDTSQ